MFNIICRYGWIPICSLASNHDAWWNASAKMPCPLQPAQRSAATQFRFGVAADWVVQPSCLRTAPLQCRTKSFPGLSNSTRHTSAHAHVLVFWINKRKQKKNNKTSMYTSIWNSRTKSAKLQAAAGLSRKAIWFVSGSCKKKVNLCHMFYQFQVL